MQWEGFQSHSLSHDSFLPFTTQLHQIIFRIPGAWRDSSTVNTVEKSCNSRKKKDSWVVEESTIDCYLLNNHASDSSRSKCPRDNVCSEIPFRMRSCHIKSSQLITIRDKLAGFSMLRFLLKCIYEQIVVYVRKCFSVETYRNCSIDLQSKWINWFLYSANFYWKVFPKRRCGLFVNTFQ